MDNDRLAGMEAGRLARERTLREAEEHGPRIKDALLRVRQALRAGRVKAHFVPGENGGWVYSKKLTDHSTRLRAADLTLQIYDAYPRRQLDVALELDFDAAVRLINERRRGACGRLAETANPGGAD